MVGQGGRRSKVSSEVATEIGVPVAVLLGAVTLDALLPPQVVVGFAFVLAPFVASALASPRQTAGIAGAAIVAVAVSAAWNHDAGTTAWWLRLLGAVVLGAMAVVLAQVRIRRERALAHMTMVAETAQRALLRVLPGRIGSVAVAARYLSATEAALVGGDLYEVADTPFGVRVLVGDVRGKGLEAVHLASAVLAAFRGSAYLRGGLPELARDLDAAVAGNSGDEDFVTAVIAEFHDDDTVGIVNCGHPPPLLLRAEETPRLLTSQDPDVPLGLGSRPTVESAPWPDRTRLLIYTDGLVEARNRAGTFFPLAELAPALGVGTLDEALDALVAHHQAFSQGVRDDLALILTEHCPDGHRR